ncbi:MAG: hypothetical protein KF797_15290 [Flavobacteriales bacterium]|nr:hypothetical protein [Flavobacteriales bacterium]
MKRTVLLLPLLLGVLGTQAQWGIQVGGHWERLMPRGLMGGIATVDHDLNDRLGISLDLSIGFGIGSSGSYSYQGYSGNYSLERRSMGFTYRSQFFLSDNDDAAVYIGPFIGFRKLNYTLNPDPYQINGWNTSAPSWVVKQTLSGALFPVGMRMGWRAPLDGFYSELFFTVGTILGDKDHFNIPYLQPKDVVGGVYLQAGYSFGVGW